MSKDRWVCGQTIEIPTHVQATHDLIVELHLQRDAVVRALLIAEFGPLDNYMECCAVCHPEAREVPHKPGCELDVALALVGLPDQASRGAARAATYAEEPPATP